MTTSVVLLHGGGTSSRQWDLVIERMVAPALALDVPGRGNRPGDVERLTLPRALDSLAADVGPLIRSFSSRILRVACLSRGLWTGLDGGCAG
jgi:pimeloyl-ACP methyl ester carboxylesterase